MEIGGGSEAERCDQYPAIEHHGKTGEDEGIGPDFGFGATEQPLAAEERLPKEREDNDGENRVECAEPEPPTQRQQGNGIGNCCQRAGEDLSASKAGKCDEPAE
jgi:hypothetical protein